MRTVLILLSLFATACAGPTAPSASHAAPRPVVSRDLVGTDMLTEMQALELLNAVAQRCLHRPLTESEIAFIKDEFGFVPGALINPESLYEIIEEIEEYADGLLQAGFCVVRADGMRVCLMR